MTVDQVLSFFYIVFLVRIIQLGLDVFSYPVNNEWFGWVVVMFFPLIIIFGLLLDRRGKK